MDRSSTEMGMSLRGLFISLFFVPMVHADSIQVGSGYYVLENQYVILASPNGQDQFTAPPGAKLTVTDIRKSSDKGSSLVVLKDSEGVQYQVSLRQLEGRVTEDPLRSALQMPSNLNQTEKATLSRGSAQCPSDQVRKSEPAMKSGPECRTTAGHPLCGEKYKCDKTPMLKEVRKSLYPWILEAVNRQNEINRAEGKLEVHPATLLSFITAESFGNPVLQAKDGGKGLGQFTFPDVAKKAGLDYYAPKPTSKDVAMSEAFNQPLRWEEQKGERRPVYSVWSPKGTILAMARKVSVDINEQRFIKGGSGAPVDASVLYRGSDLLSTRYLAGYYNRQQRVFNSIEEYYRVNGQLPRDYGQAWSTQASSPDKKLLYKQCINRCHVEKIAGLCGESPQGFFGTYASDFIRQGNRWVAA